MKTRHVFTILICLLMGGHAEAQFLKKLKKKAEQAVERTILNRTDREVSKTTDNAIDSITKGGERKKHDANSQVSATSNNVALELNTEAKHDFYQEDVVVDFFENKSKTQTQYFDKEEVALQFVLDGKPEPGYIDSEGYFYSYNKNENQYNKSAVLAQGQGMMMPMMMIEAYKLPPEPFMAQFQKQQDLGLTANPFNGIVEFAFIYEPENFRYEDFNETKQKINGKTYTRFDFLNEPGYEGSYVLFDDKDRLVEIYTKSTGVESNMETMEMGSPAGETGLKYNYKPVDVKLPPAVEKKSLGQDLMGTVMGSFKKNKNPDDIDEDDYDTSDSKGMTTSIKKSMKNNKVTADMLPESYDFDYIYKTTLVQDSKKRGSSMEMNFLVNTKNPNYNGSEYVDSKRKQQGTVTMVFDLNLNAMALFIKGQGNNNMVQIMPIPEVKPTNAKIDFTIRELPPKSILGYNCSGLQLENDKYILSVYHAKNAPISLNNFFGFGGSKGSRDLNLPDVDPKLLNQFEDSLVMEMQYEDKKKKKNNFVVTAKSIEKTPNSIYTKDYQSLNMLSGMKMFKD